MYGEVKSFMMNQLDRGASQAGTRILSTAESLKRIATELRSDELSRPTAQLADNGARTLEQLGRYLEASNGERLIADAERYGRERPWVIASVGAAVGLVGSRMLKASAARRYRFDSGGYAAGGSYGESKGTAYEKPYDGSGLANATPFGSGAASAAAASRSGPTETSRLTASDGS